MDELLNGFALVRKMIELQAQELVKTADNATIVDIADAFPYYIQSGLYKVGDIRRHPETGQPKKCRQEYDATLQTEWTINDDTIWIPFHGISESTAYPWAKPTGAHDMYRTGEYMTFTDTYIYKCLSDTSFSPEEYAIAWEQITFPEVVPEEA